MLVLFLILLGKDIEIDYEGVIDASGRGWSQGDGPGAGISDVDGSSGASHGGLGVVEEVPLTLQIHMEIPYIQSTMAVEVVNIIATVR